MNFRSLIFSLAGCAALVSLAPAQTWTRLPNGPPNAGVSLLLTDGTVMVHEPSSPNWWKLKPDAFGNYVTGSWTRATPMASDYGPLYFASAVLPDGRMIVLGGEYNFGQGVWTNKGAMYDPLTNTWKNQVGPGWANIGDAQCVVLDNGKFELASLGNAQATFDPATGTWQQHGSGHQGVFNEESWTKLPDGSIFTVNSQAAPLSQRFIPSLDQWISAGNTPVILADAGSLEIGPNGRMYDGRVACFGGTGHNAIWTPGANLMDQGTWATLPDFPMLNGQLLAMADAPSCIMPNGHILVATAPGVFGSPTVFFEFDGATFTQVPGTPNAAQNPCYVGNMLTLPSGQVLFTDFSGDVEVYTPTGGPQDAWRPTITSYPTSVQVGQTFQLFGRQLNGLSENSCYGDDSSNATNYPLVKVTNNATGHVFFCRTFNHSTMAIATGSAIVNTFVKIPNGIELGASKIQVVTNGISSPAMNITITPGGTPADAISVYEGTLVSGTLTEILKSDNKYFSINSKSVVRTGHVASANVHFKLGASTATGFNISAETRGVSGCSSAFYLWDWTTNTWVFQYSGAISGADTVSTFHVSSPSKYIKSGTREVKMIVRGINPTNTVRTGTPFTYKIDYVALAID